MRVLLTGGTGSVGPSAIRRLVAAGHDVLVVGRREGLEAEGAEYAVCDVRDAERVREVMRGRDAVVHLAAVASPGGVPAPELYRANVLGSIHVYEAAAREGIRRVVQASSINAIGCHWGVVPLKPAYFPIDEEMPTHTTDPYSFSKQLIEEVAAYYWRRDGISGASLRLPAVWRVPRDPERLGKRRRQTQLGREALDAFAAVPESERARRLEVLHAWADAHRAARHDEFETRQQKPPRTPPPEDPIFWVFLGRYNLWTAVDERDSAQAIEKALTADYGGSHTLFINDRDNWLGYDTRALIGLLFSEVGCWKRPVTGAESLVSIDQARALIGYEPEHPTAL